MPVILADTTVLNNFAQIGRPDLLRKAFPGLAAPREVRVELSEGERLGLVPAGDWSWLETLELEVRESDRAAELRRHLQDGEAACLAMVESRGGLVLTDDGAARRFAARLSIEVSGTLGVLARLLHHEFLTLAQGDAFLAQMMARGYRCPIRSLRELT
jgi:predicted nucleic acid-binding protein